MGQQQLLLIILGVIIVGIAIAVGLSMFSAQSISANRDAIINDLNNLAANAYQHRIRPASMGGGGGAYDNSAGGTEYAIPATLQSNENADYEATIDDADNVTFTATSKTVKEADGTTAATIKVTVGPDGRIDPTSWEYSDAFK